MKDILGVLVLLISGPFFLWIGVQSLRHRRWRDSVPLLEAMIDHAAGLEPPPRNIWDRRFAFAQAILFTIFGAFFTLCLAAILISTFAE
ncbi:MAG: hypothetical protein E2598_04970 [Sphingobium sp.]|nr:hypothetical protein [Sphingobium sp.]